MNNVPNNNKDVVRRYLKCLGERNAAAAGDCLADDVTWWWVGGRTGGKADLRATHERIFSLTNSMLFTIGNEVAEGDMVATEAKVVYQTKDGRELHNDVQLTVTLKNGKFQDVREYYDMSRPPLKAE